ncbi:MAG: M42 family metallopeptidase [Bacillota bacterium]|jgi:putative aminopeptidase FrvX
MSITKELEEILMVPGVTGYEEPIREYLSHKVTELGLSYQVDPLGNLITEIGSGHKNVILLAHMDELGLIVSYIEDNGYARFRKIHGVDDRMISGRAMNVLTENGPIPAVVGVKPPHLMSDKSEENKTVPWEHLYLDLGTRSRQETLDLGVDVLTPVVFQKQFNVLNGEYLSCRAMDDRFGCLVLLKVLENLINENLPYRLTCVWTVKEEIGLHGAKGIAASLAPNIAIAVDSFATADMPEVPFHLAPARLGEGPVLRAVDNYAMSDTFVRKFFQKVCREHNIPLQIAMTRGGTDGSALQAAGVPMLAVAVAVRYMHSMVEMIHRGDCEQLIQMLSLGLKEIPQIL